MTLTESIILGHAKNLREAASFLESLLEVRLEHVGVDGNRDDLVAGAAGEGQGLPAVGSPVHDDILGANIGKRVSAVRANVPVFGGAKYGHAQNRSGSVRRGKSKVVPARKTKGGGR